MEGITRARFPVDEAGELIELATQIGQADAETLSYAEVVKIASELGIEERHLRDAIVRSREQAPRVISGGVLDRCLTLLCLQPASRDR